MSERIRKADRELDYKRTTERGGSSKAVNGSRTNVRREGANRNEN